MDKQYYIYIMTNFHNTVFYTGMSNDLIRRVYEHKYKPADGFTKKYKLKKLVYYEIFTTAFEAITREKQIKAGSRADKWQRIHIMNPTFKDLYHDLIST